MAAGVNCFANPTAAARMFASKTQVTAVPPIAQASPAVMTAAEEVVVIARQPRAVA